MGVQKNYVAIKQNISSQKCIKMFIYDYVTAFDVFQRVKRDTSARIEPIASLASARNF